MGIFAGLELMNNALENTFRSSGNGQTACDMAKSVLQHSLDQSFGNDNLATIDAMSLCRGLSTGKGGRQC